MKQTPTIHSLRKAGNKVRVIHRFWDSDDEVRVFRSSVASDANPNVTQIDITTTDGRDVSGFAYRARGDQYNRKLGNQIALNRALKYLTDFKI